MKGTLEPEARLREGSGLRAMDSLSEPAIRRRLLLDAVQHPATLLPLAVAVMSVLYLLLVSAIVGGGLWAMVLLVVSGIGTAAGFVWRYVLRYTEEYGKRARGLMDRLEEERARLEHAEAAQRREALEAGFSAIGSTEGLKALAELVSEYEQLQPALGYQRDTDPFSMSLVLSLAVETYRQGLSILSDALELMRAVDTPGRERLETELAEMQRQVLTLRLDESQAGRLKLKEDTLASHRERLDMLDQLQLRLERFLFQAGRCEASLHRTRIELAAIRTGGSEATVDSVTEALRRTIHQVKEVQEELKKLGY